MDAVSAFVSTAGIFNATPFILNDAMYRFLKRDETPVWAYYRRTAERVSKRRTPFGESIDIRSSDGPISHAAQSVESLLVRFNNYYIHDSLPRTPGSQQRLIGLREGPMVMLLVGNCSPPNAPAVNVNT